MWDLGAEYGLSDEACRKFRYALYEVEVTLLVDPETGNWSIKKFEET